jgi:O-antigen/teichoic acid export membrane protein
MSTTPTSEMLHKSARQGWMWGAIEQFAYRGLSMIVSLVLARMLAPESFGLIASVSIFLTTAQQLIDGGIASSIVQKKEILEEDYVAFFWCNAMASLLTCGPLILFAGAISRFYGNPQLRAVMMVMAAVIFLMNAGRVQELRLVRELRFKTISLVTIASIVAGSITGLILAFAGTGVWAILGQQLVISSVRAAGFLKTVKWRPRGLPSWRAVKDIYVFGLPICLSQTIRDTSEQLINVLTARYIGLAPLGYYDRGKFIPGNLSSFINSIFVRTNLTVLSKVQHDEPKFREAYLKLIRTMASLCIFIMTGLAVCAPEIIEVVLGAKWLPSTWFLRANCVMISLYLLFITNLEVLKAKGAVSVLFWQNILYAGLQAAGVGMGLRWGLPGMVLGGIAACFFSCITLGLAVGRISHITIGDQARAFIRPAIWSLLTAGVLWVIRQSDQSVWIRFLLCGAAGASGLYLLWQTRQLGVRSREQTLA